MTHFFEIAGERYATSRLFMLGVAIVVGVALWLWLDRTRMGMIIRAGVDDRDMVRVINILAVFAITFFVGAFLAGVGGHGRLIRRCRAWGGRAVAPQFAGGGDRWWLGLAERGGGRVPPLRIGGFVLSCLPARGVHLYSIILTFVLLAVVLAVRPYGLFGRPA